MHRETTISREIKLLKNKFELLEKNRQFRSILQKSNTQSGNPNLSDINNEDLASGLDSSELQTNRSGATSEADSMLQLEHKLGNVSGLRGSSRLPLGAAKSVRIKLTKLNSLSQLISPIVSVFGSSSSRRRSTGKRRKSNRVSSITAATGSATLPTADGIGIEAPRDAQGGSGELQGKGDMPTSGGAKQERRGFLSRLFRR